MSKEYVPTTEQVREQYTREQPPVEWTQGERERSFDRWLKAHDAQVRAEALRDAADELARRAKNVTNRHAQIGIEAATGWLRDRADDIARGGRG